MGHYQSLLGDKLVLYALETVDTGFESGVGAVGWNIGELRDIATGMKAVFLAFCT